MPEPTEEPLELRRIGVEVGVIDVGPGEQVISPGERPPLNIGVLISGSGTNLQAIIDACATRSLDARVTVVISNKEGAFGLERARRAGIPAVYIDPTAYGDIRKYNHAIAEALLAHDVELVVMAGYMRLLGKEVLQTYPGAVINLHPALLPAFPGSSAITEAFDYGVKVTGVTVHFADEAFDRGPIIIQEPVLVEEADTVSSLEAKIHAVEHRLLPEAIALIAAGRVRIIGRVVHVT